MFAWVCCCVVAASSFVVAQEAVRTEEISVGGSKLINLGFAVQRADVVKKDVVDVVRTEQESAVLFKGKTPGTTDVRVFAADGRAVAFAVTVVEDIEKVKAAVDKLLGGVPGITIEAMGSRVVITGRLLKPSDERTVKKVEQIFGSQVVSMASLDTGPYNSSLAEEIQNRIAGFLKVVNVKVDIINENVQLSGDVYDEQQKKRAEEIAGQYGRKVLNLLDVTEATVEVDVVFAKIAVAENKSIGHNLLEDVTLSGEGSVRGGRGQQTDYTWSATAKADLSGVLKSFARNGDVQELAKPHISAKSGKGGTFHSGGVLYVPVSGAQVADLKEVDYGLYLKVTPEITSPTEINCDIEVSVRAPTEGGGGGLTALNVSEHKIETSLRCEMNQTMILSGLISSMGTESLDGFPVLRNVPMLNYFFSKKSKTEQKEELVILMTPREIKGIESDGAATSEDTIRTLDKMNR